MRIKIIAEIGINHNGSVQIAKDLIDIAAKAGCNFVKFQKREPDVCVPEEQKGIIKKDTPWGDITYLDYKKKTEFGSEEYKEIDLYCKKLGIDWFASAWDIPSVDFLSDFSDKCKIPSALITDNDLLIHARKTFNELLVSTGMSTEEEIVTCVNVSDPDVIFHTNSTYPSPVSELNLNYIKHLKTNYPNKEIGYSGHEYGLTTTFAAVALGSTWIERHVTLDRTMWGSDQLASVEPVGLEKLVRGIRDIESALGSSGERQLFKSELSKRKSLRGV